MSSEVNQVSVMLFPFFNIFYQFTTAGKRLLGRLRHRWKDNIRMDLEKIGINTRNLVDLAQDRNYWRALVNAVLNLLVP